MKKAIWLIVICTLLSGALSAQDWVYDPGQAFDMSKKSGKIVFVDVFTTWCHWCKKLDQETFSQPMFQEIGKKFVLLKVDGDRYPEFRREHQVKGYPTMLFLNGMEKEVHKRAVGYMPASRLVPIMKDALKLAVRNELKWYTDPAKAFKAAKGQPIFVDVFATWCHWCKKLDQETFPAPSFQQEASRFILLKVDGDLYPDFVSLHSVKGYPTMLFLDQDGEEIHERVVGYLPANKLVPIMQQVDGHFDYSLPWISTYDEALAESQATGKPIFFWASMKGCHYCEKLEKYTFNTPGFMNESENFVLVKLMRNENSKYMAKYAIKGWPQMLFLNAKGEEFYQRMIGYYPLNEVLPEMRKALKKHSGQ